MRGAPAMNIHLRRAKNAALGRGGDGIICARKTRTQKIPPPGVSIIFRFAPTIDEDELTSATGYKKCSHTLCVVKAKNL